MRNNLFSLLKPLLRLSLASILALPVSGRAMTVAEAVAYAMEHNRDILSVREQIVQRRGQVTEARADAFPELNLSLSSFRVRDPGFLNSTFGQSLLKGGGGDEETPDDDGNSYYYTGNIK